MSANIKLLFGKRHAFIDVFVGEGWENWTRVKIEKDIMHHIKGRHLTKEEANYVFNNRKP